MERNLIDHSNHYLPIIYTNMNKVLTIILLATVVAVNPAKAQSEGGLLLGAEVEKKISQDFSLSIEGDFRSRNNFKTIDRWSGGIGGSYKLTKWLKADAGYTLLYDNNREKVTPYTTDKGRSRIKWRPSYWGTRHRFYTSLSLNHKFNNNLRISLRERWQYTYRPEQSVTRWKLTPADLTKELDEDYVRTGRGKHQLRSRLQVEYDKKRALFTPFANAEFYNSMAIEKIRYTVGTDVRLSRAHSLSVYYRFQDMKNMDDDDYDPDMHYLGLGYKFKF